MTYKEKFISDIISDIKKATNINFPDDLLQKIEKEILITVDMYDLTNLIGSNHKSLTYYPDTKKWIIVYKNGLNPDQVDNDSILEFLDNA